MNTWDRELLIAETGIETATAIENLRNDIDALHEYLNVVKVAHTKGYRLMRNAEFTPDGF